MLVKAATLAAVREELTDSRLAAASWLLVSFELVTARIEFDLERLAAALDEEIELLSAALETEAADRLDETKS